MSYLISPPAQGELLHSPLIRSDALESSLSLSAISLLLLLLYLPLQVQHFISQSLRLRLKLMNDHLLLLDLALIMS